MHEISGSFWKAVLYGDIYYGGSGTFHSVGYRLRCQSMSSPGLNRRPPVGSDRITRRLEYPGRLSGKIRRLVIGAFPGASHSHDAQLLDNYGTNGKDNATDNVHEESLHARSGHVDRVLRFRAFERGQ